MTSCLARGLSAPRQGDLLDDITRFCDTALGEDGICAFLHRERDHLFPDEFFADLFAEQGRRSVPPSVVATVMVLQRLEGLSDREAVERFTCEDREANPRWVRALSAVRRPENDRLATILGYTAPRDTRPKAQKLAEGEGFEPPRAWRPLRFSRPLRSTTPASLRGSIHGIRHAGEEARLSRTGSMIHPSRAATARSPAGRGSTSRSAAAE